MTILRVAAALLLAACTLVVNAAVTTAPSGEREQPAPSPSLDPEEVVRIQVEALRSNSALDDGIKLTYAFASPGNKSQTGPLDRFVRMLRSAPYDRLLNHRDADFGPMAISGSEAFQRVVVTDRQGKKVVYFWALSRQTEGEFKDCWMTDAVIPEERQTPRQLA